MNQTEPESLATLCKQQGYRAFKLKVGFGCRRDHMNLQSLRGAVSDCDLMVDANQAWDLATACSEAKSLEAYGLRWLEEPLRANRPWAEWKELAATSPVPLAGGENLASNEAFDQALDVGALKVVQPDLDKWGELGLACHWHVVFARQGVNIVRITWVQALAYWLRPMCWLLLGAMVQRRPASNQLSQHLGTAEGSEYLFG